MIVEGERVKALVRQAKSEVILCSPFIKAKVLSVLLDVIRDGVSVVIVTRWRPAEIAAGVSDLEVLDLANERPQTEVRLLHSLHAKLYVADEHCLLGSANLTASALGWREDSNLELLVSAHRNDTDLAFLLGQLESATPATFQLRAEVAELAANLDVPALDEAKDISTTAIPQARRAWLPRCAAPEKLYDVYLDPDTTTVVEGTRADAQADLADLLPQPGLTSDEFTVTIAETLSRIPSIQEFLNRIPAGLSDTQGEQAVSELRDDVSESDARRHWHIVRQWISIFFRDKFEVAPQNFVVRLKPR